MIEMWGFSKSGGTSHQHAHLWIETGINRTSRSRCGLVEKSAKIYGEMNDTRCARCVKLADKDADK